MPALQAKNGSTRMPAGIVKVCAFGLASAVMCALAAWRPSSEGTAARETESSAGTGQAAQASAQSNARPTPAAALQGARRPAPQTSSARSRAPVAASTNRFREPSG